MQYQSEDKYCRPVRDDETEIGVFLNQQNNEMWYEIDGVKQGTIKNQNIGNGVWYPTISFQRKGSSFKFTNTEINKEKVKNENV